MLYETGKSTAVCVRHHTVTVLKQHLVHASTQFPKGEALGKVILDSKNPCGLPHCGGSVDGTFRKMQKSAFHEDLYYYHKQFTATLILACVDARGMFTYVNAGNPGMVGDAAAFNTACLSDKRRHRKWLGSHSAIVDGIEVHPIWLGMLPLPCHHT